jgi:uncharacterized protein YbbC (DUF1343 family)
MGIELAAALRKLYPDQWKVELMLTLLANREAYDAVVRGDDPRAIAQAWQDDLEKFKELRQKYLLYK